MIVLDRFAIERRGKRGNLEATKNTTWEEEPRFSLSSPFVLFVPSWFPLFPYKQMQFDLSSEALNVAVGSRADAFLFRKSFLTYTGEKESGNCWS